MTNLREPSSYQPRLVDARLAQLLREFPAIALSGPRAVGKTTTALRHANDIARLDVPAQAAAFRLDPDAALRGRGEPLVLDEWQEVPEVLGAVKRAVDDDHRPGRFILTGSVRAELTQATWPGTGRLVRVQMFGLTEREVRGNVGSDRPGFVDRLATADPDQLAGADRETSIPDYVELALRSGFPEIATSPLADEDRAAWLDGYLGQLLTRDAHALDPRRDVQRMRRYFEVLALNTAGTPSEASLFDAAGINARTAAAYDHLFENLFVTERVPAWTTNRLSRVSVMPKRYLLDPALAAAAGRFTASAVLRDGNLLGRMVDTFALAQLRPEVAIPGSRRRAHYLRTRGGRQEIDLIVELGDGLVLALECKAGAAPSTRDARHLVWLREQLGDRFVAGAVLHTGPDVFVLGDRIFAVPLSAMWA